MRYELLPTRTSLMGVPIPFQRTVLERREQKLGGLSGRKN